MALMAAAACTPEAEPEEAEEQEPVGDPYDLPGPRQRLTLEQLPPMPAFPAAERGRLVVTSDGDFPVQGSWLAQAGLCPATSTVELYTEDLGHGAAIVLQFADSALTGSYKVVPHDSESSDDKVALIGVQIFHDRDAFGLFAIDGEMEVLQDGRYLSGRFTSTLKELQVAVLTQFVGVFEQVRLEELSPEYCVTLSDSLEARLAVEPDTTLVEERR